MSAKENSFSKEKIINYLTDFISAERQNRLLQVLNQRTRYLTVVIEDLFQTQNISAVLRTCECFGIQDVHIIEKDYDFQIHKAISMGANKWLTLYNYKNEPNNTVKCIQQLKNKGYWIIATVPTPDSVSIYDIPLDRPSAFCFGTELTGLSEECIAMADQRVTIPMHGFTESFNISNSVAIILAHCVKKMKAEISNWELSQDEKNDLYFEWLQKSIKESDFIIRDYKKRHNL
ncbi:MAG TPA: RNA methyltransferase [Bacteroidales bacterium]|jgi:tRNA (guanosine-2'-O-)-methyltransferase|nr:RNA methyltransferase [Bacteroidales bacterium]